MSVPRMDAAGPWLFGLSSREAGMFFSFPVSVRWVFCAGRWGAPVSGGGDMGLYVSFYTGVQRLTGLCHGCFTKVGRAIAFTCPGGWGL